MSRHEGVSCDSCLKSNFRGRRYKCLICYDYDLCSTCYEAGATTTRHTADHPMQCILTRNDFDLYYGGEALTAEQPQSFSCPYCGKMGYTETTLQDHVTAEHADASTEVVCPICAAHPGGDPNYVTDDFAEHLTLQHRTPRGEFDEPTGIRHVRRIPHPGRGVGGTRTRRANMHFSSGGSSLAGLSPGNRDTMDPIAELLSQLSSVRSRAAATQSVSSQLQQLEMQLQSTRQQLERLPSRRQVDTSKNNMTNSSTTGSNADSQAGHVESSTETSNISSPYLLARCMNMSEESEQSLEQERVDRSIFVQELLLSSLTEQLHIHEDMEDLGSMSDSLKLPTASEEAKVNVSSASQNCTVQNNLLVAKSAPGEKSNQAVYVIAQPSGVGGGGGGGGASVGSHSRGNLQFGAPVYHGVIPGSPGQYNPLQSSNPIPGLAGAGIGAGNPHPLPGRPLSGGRERDTRVNPAAVKKTMFKQLSTSQTSDREPPPH